MTSPENMRFEYLFYPSHSAAINGLDVCIKKQYVATCSSDKTVRIWDYERKTLEIVQNFSEEGHSLAFHPSGWHLIVGFTDKLRFMNIIEKSIVGYKDVLLKSCKEIKFSHGGHLFAAACVNNIYVFRFYTGECPPHMKFSGSDMNITCI